MNPQNTNDKDSNDGSLLDQIMSTQSDDATSNSEENQNSNNNINNSGTQTPQNPNNKPPNDNLKKKKSSMKPGDFFRLFGALFLAGTILFSVFIAYIVFNPDQTQFFISLGINPQDIKDLLGRLVNISFGILTSGVAIITLIFLFRAIVTKKQYAKKKTLSIILSIFFVLLLMGVISLWAFLWKLIGQTDYVNPNGGILIYDVYKSKSDKFAGGKDQITSFNNLIGPLSLKYDLSADARYVSKYITIESYEIDFNGDGEVDKTGVNPGQDNGIIYTYSEKGNYSPEGVYHGLDKVTKQPKDIEMRFPAISIIGVVELTQENDRMGGKRATFDLSDIKDLGKSTFYIEDNDGNFNTPDTDYDGGDIYKPDKTFKDETLICLSISDNREEFENCDRMFIVGAEGIGNFGGKIEYKQNKTNPLYFFFDFKPSDPDASIESYEWTIGKNVISTKKTFDYEFKRYSENKFTVNLDILLKTGKTYNFSENISLVEPLRLVKPASTGMNKLKNSLLRIDTKDGKSVIDGTWDRDTNLYHIVTEIPNEFIFNSSYVKVEQAFYELDTARWDFDGDGEPDKIGKIINFEFLENKKYDVIVEYTFVKKRNGEVLDEQIISEQIVIEAGEKEFNLNLDIKPDSDYAPTIVHFDGSASEVKEGRIVKFSYDFGEGKGEKDYDAKVNYNYKYPGEYEVIFTATKQDGTKESIKKMVILKEQTKTVKINTSVSTGFVGKNIDFDANGTIGQINTYSWDFGDGYTSTDPSPTHSYSKTGDYKIKLTVTFDDGVIITGDRTITVK